MQTSSINLARALTGGEVTWEKPRVWADWARDGYGAIGSIDDLADQIGRPFQVEHYLDNGYPAEVTLITGVGTPSVAIPLVNGGMGTSGYRLERASQYFSPFRGDSPLFGYQRDVAPFKVDIGAVGAGGVEATRIFTGQMVNTSLDGIAAEVQAVSASRLKLAKAVQPPIRLSNADGLTYGLTATWPVTWSMHQCGVYPSPPLVSGGRLWIPQHGGGYPYYPSDAIPFDGGALVGEKRTSAGVALDPPDYIQGPYVGMVSGGVTPTLMRGTGGTFTSQSSLASGDDFFSKAGNKGRFQFWVRADAANVNTAPGGSGSFKMLGATTPTATLAGLTVLSQAADFTRPYIQCGVRASDRRPFITLYDGAVVVTVPAANPLPTDGSMVSLGFAWDVAGGSLTVNNNGTVLTSPVVVTTANLDATNTAGVYPFIDFGFSMMSWLPWGEIQFSSGAAASITANPAWQDTGWTQTATVYPSILPLVSIQETAPREAWEYIGSWAQSELAAFRTDENDRVLYLPLPYWAKTAPQTVTERLTSNRHGGQPKVTIDPSKIRNSVVVNYSAIYSETTPSDLYVLRSPVAVPPGVSLYLFPMSNPGRVFVSNTPVVYTLTAAEVATPPAFYTGPNKTVSFISFNTAADGTGSYSIGTASSGTDLVVSILDYNASSVLIQISNNTGTTYYITNNNSSIPFMRIAGMAIQQETVSATVTDTAGVALRGERALVVPLPGIQTQASALQIGAALLGDLSNPAPEITVQLFGDPRRQPGDLVAYSDVDNTGVGGYWRYRLIRHNIDAAAYTQDVAMRRAYLVGVWDTDLWGNAVWGE